MADHSPNGGARWQMWSAIITAGVVAVGFMSTVAYNVVSISIQQALQSTKNADVERRLDGLRLDLEALKLRDAQQKAALIEIETQFCASDTARNLTHATDLRTVALLWQRTFGESFPIGNAYYPQICNRQVK